MVLGLFGAGTTQIRACPACERKIKADATFCPTCYMVFRPEGSAALREYLHGERVPADVYLLRKMQTEDPDAGPVTRVAPEPTDHQKTPAEDVPTAPIVATPTPVSAMVTQSVQVEPANGGLSEVLASEKTPPSRAIHSGRPRSKSRNRVEGFLAFVEPLPPSEGAENDVPGLYAWMLERDPVIPNNLTRLQEIHAEVFQNKPAASLGYEQHLLLQVTDDLGLYTTEEALKSHLAQLAVAYRRAAEAYRRTENDDAAAVNLALWQMASLATRMRLEA